MVTVRLWRTSGGEILIESAPGSFGLVDSTAAIVALYEPRASSESERAVQTSYSVEGSVLVAFTEFAPAAGDDTRYANIKLGGLVPLVPEASPVPIAKIEAAIARFKEARDKSPSDHLVVKYTLGVDRVVEPRYIRVALVPSAAEPVEALEHKKGLGLQVEEVARRSNRRLPLGFWYVWTYIPEPRANAEGTVNRWVDMNVLSSQQLLERLGQGHTVCVISGPFDTKEAASYDMDVRLESPE